MLVLCPVCNGDEELVHHTLVTCPFAHQCWQKRGTVVQVTGDESFAWWLQKMIDRNNKNQYGEIATMCWIIWQARNNLVWNRNRSEVQNVVYSTKRYLVEWKQAQVISTKTLYRDIVQDDGGDSWVKPNKNIVKITVDAAVFKDQAKYGVGMLVRDDEGEIIQGRSELFQGEVRSDYAEAMAVKEALSWVKQEA